MNVPGIINQLTQKYKYKPLPEDIAHKYRQLWLESLPRGFCVDGKSDRAIHSKSGAKIATGYTRIVIGDYGAYVEMSPDCIVTENIQVKPGQERRISDPAYKWAKYHWYQPKDDQTCKLYHQQRTVPYADYLPGMWYVSPFEVTTVNEVRA